MERKTEYPIHDLFIKRWSPRSLTGEKLTDGELFRLFEAAKWAPSSYNSQPWRFLYSHKDDKHWSTFVDFLVDANKAWAKNASVLIVILSRKTFSRNGKFSPTHLFDTGAAWQNMALQATEMGLATHGIGGFDADKARSELGVPDEFDVIAMVAVGKQDSASKLPEALERVEEPSNRQGVSEISTAGSFKDTLWS